MHDTAWTLAQALFGVWLDGWRRHPRVTTEDRCALIWRIEAWARRV